MPIGDWVSRFPASDPSPDKVETFKTGYSPSGLAVDSKGNVWVTCRLGTSEKGKAIMGQMIETARKGGNPDPILTRAMAELRTAPRGRQRYGVAARRQGSALLAHQW